MQNPELMRRLAADQRAWTPPPQIPSEEHSAARLTVTPAAGPARRPPRRLFLFKRSQRRRGLGAPVTVKADSVGLAEEAAAMLSGQGDVLLAGTGRSLPVGVKLAVLAHADLERLRELSRYNLRSSVHRSWGTTMAELAGEIARRCRTQEALAHLQAEALVPLEFEMLTGRRALLSDADLAQHVHERVLCTCV